MTDEQRIEYLNETLYIECILYDVKSIMHDLITDDINELKNDLTWLYWKFKYTNYKRKYDKQKYQV